jgi:hypothetical protein
MVAVAGLLSFAAPHRARADQRSLPVLTGWRVLHDAIPGRSEVAEGRLASTAPLLGEDSGVERPAGTWRRPGRTHRSSGVHESISWMACNRLEPAWPERPWHLAPYGVRHRQPGSVGGRGNRPGGGRTPRAGAVSQPADAWAGLTVWGRLLRGTSRWDPAPVGHAGPVHPPDWRLQPGLERPDG